MDEHMRDTYFNNWSTQLIILSLFIYIFVPILANRTAFSISYKLYNNDALSNNGLIIKVKLRQQLF